MEETGYPENWIRAACVHIYGKPIAARTWAKYKHICRIPDKRKSRTNTISKTHCQWLMMLAYMRYEQSLNSTTKQPVGRNAGITLPQIIKRLNSSPVLKQNLDKALGDAIYADGILGADVPHWLSRQIGRCPSIKTLRRWAKKHNLEFSTHKTVSTKTLDAFLAIA